MKQVKFYMLGCMLVTAATLIACNGLEYQGTPLHQAAISGDFNEVKRLIESGADPKIKDENGERAAWEAIRTGHHEIAKYLIDQGGDLNYKNNQGTSRAGEYNYPKKRD